MARTIPHRELRNSSSDVLRQVKHGETFTITNHGEIVAILSPPEKSAISELRIRKAKRPRRFREIRKVKSDLSTAQVLDELRDET